MQRISVVSMGAALCSPIALITAQPSTPRLPIQRGRPSPSAACPGIGTPLIRNPWCIRILTGQCVGITSYMELTDVSKILVVRVKMEACLNL